MHKFDIGQEVISRSDTVYRILDIVIEPDGSPSYRVCQFRDGLRRNRGWFGRVHILKESDLRPKTQKGGISTPPLNERYRR